MPPVLALLSTLIGSKYPSLELIFMVPKVFEPLKFDCSTFGLPSYPHLTSVAKTDSTQNAPANSVQEGRNGGSNQKEKKKEKTVYAQNFSHWGPLRIYPLCEFIFGSA